MSARLSQTMKKYLSATTLELYITDERYIMSERYITPEVRGLLSRHYN